MKLDSINRNEAFRYMGYGSNTPDDRVVSVARECERMLLESIDAKYTYRYFGIENPDGTDSASGTVCVSLEGCDLILLGDAIREHLKECRGVVLLAATLSEAVDRLIRRLELNRMTAALIADSMASAAIEQVCDIAEKEIMDRFPGSYCTWRFSPGYGDFPLECQRRFLDVLDAPKRIGVNITRGGLMTPCKSVTAVIGVSDKEIERKRRGCSVCSMRDKCTFRRKGEHCGI